MYLIQCIRFSLWKVRRLNEAQGLILQLKLSTTATLGTEEIGHCVELAIVERLKQESMNGLSAKKVVVTCMEGWPLCRGGCYWRFDCIIWLNLWSGARCRESCILIGYTSGQNLAHLGLISYMYTVCWSCKKKFSFWPYKKSFIDQTCSVKMSGYWPHSHFGLILPFFVFDFAVLSALPETSDFGVNLPVWNFSA